MAREGGRKGGRRDGEVDGRGLEEKRGKHGHESEEQRRGGRSAGSVDGGGRGRDEGESRALGLRRLGREIAAPDERAVGVGLGDGGVAAVGDPAEVDELVVLEQRRQAGARVRRLVKVALRDLRVESVRVLVRECVEECSPLSPSQPTVRENERERERERD